MEKKLLLLRKYGKINTAAAQLGVSRMTLYRWSLERVRFEIKKREEATKNESTIQGKTKNNV